MDIATNSGAKDYVSFENIHEIVCNKEDFYKVRNEIEKKIDNFEYSGIEWRPYTYLSLKKEEYDKILETFKSLEDLDDVQKVYTNVNIK